MEQAGAEAVTGGVQMPPPMALDNTNGRSGPGDVPASLGPFLWDNEIHMELVEGIVAIVGVLSAAAAVGTGYWYVMSERRRR